MEQRERIESYFRACGHGSAQDIAGHFTADAVIFDTNIDPMRTASGIGEAWTKVRDRWGGAEWFVDSFVSDGLTAAIEWSMTGREPKSNKAFVFRGSEHYSFAGNLNLISEIRQYWTLDLERLDTGLVAYDHPAHAQEKSGQ